MKLYNDKIIMIAMLFVIAGTVLGYFSEVFHLLTGVGFVIFVVHRYRVFKKE